MDAATAGQIKNDPDPQQWNTTVNLQNKRSDDMCKEVQAKNGVSRICKAGLQILRSL